MFSVTNHVRLQFGYNSVTNFFYFKALIYNTLYTIYIIFVTVTEKIRN